jgi:hypothetical protein
MLRRMLVLAVLATVCGWARPAPAGNRHASVPANPETTRAVQYAAMSEEFCLAELREREVPFERVGPTRGVETPIRFAGPVRGIRFVQTYRIDLDPKAPATILDCRLALAIDDMAEIMARYGVVELEYLSMYRPGYRRPGVRHPSGRAIDVATVLFDDGERVSVEHDFHGRVGASTCGHAAEPPRRATRGAAFWRDVVCELDDLRSYNLIVTPNYDWGHKDHLHLEVRSGIKWYLTQ